MRGASYIEGDLLSTCRPLARLPADEFVRYLYGRLDDWSALDTENGYARVQGNYVMDIESFKRNFSMPLGGPMYAAPPYPFRGVQDLMIRYEADGAAVSELLPPHLEPADDPAICTSWARWIPFSAFGPYHEAFVMVDVMLGDTR